jgi:hypothetical protein
MRPIGGNIMGRLWLSCKMLFLIFALFHGSAFWHTELQAAKIYLSWRSTSDNEDGFRIVRFVAGYVDAILTVPANITLYVDSELVDGTVYCYHVEAFNSAGGSTPSNLACATAVDE